MGLINKQVIESTAAKLYRLPGQNRKLIVGLGNPGEEYESTRHNIGWRVVDKLTEETGVGWSEKKDLFCQLATTKVNNCDVILMRPLTYMNNSGKAVRAVMDFYKLQPADVIVVHDELDLDLGVVKSKLGGGSAGNNGIKSVISHLGEDFSRIRIGIGPKPIIPKKKDSSWDKNTNQQMDAADFVLNKFSKEEEARLPQILTAASQAVKDLLAS